MALLILFALLATPIIEIAAFIEIGGRVGVLATLALTVVTAVIGTALLRYQGLRTLYKVRENLDRGALPVDEVFDGFFLVLAGALLLTPGFVTDGLGFLLFAPPVRNVIKAMIRRHLVQRGAVHVHMHRASPPPGEADRADGVIIEGEFTEEGPDAQAGESTRDPRLPRS